MQSGVNSGAESLPQERVEVKGTRWLLLPNPWNLTKDQRERLPTLVRWSSPLVRGLVPEGILPTFWVYKQLWRAKLSSNGERDHAVAARAVYESCTHPPVT